MKRFARAMIVGAVGIAVVYAFLDITVGVGFYRLVPLDNDPLTNSVAVASVSSNRITFADGRVLVMFGFSPQLLEQSTRDCDFAVGVELESRDLPFASVYVKRKLWICGTGQAGIVVPLFRREVPLCYRSPLGVGEFQ